jgi:hypothetical protein
MRNTADVTDGKPIAVLLQSNSGVSTINPLVAFYDIHGKKREVLFFYFVLDTTRDFLLSLKFMYNNENQMIWVRIPWAVNEYNTLIYAIHGCFMLLLTGYCINLWHKI